MTGHKSQCDTAKKSQELLETKLARVQKVALAAALVPLALAGSAPSQADLLAKVKVNVTKTGAAYNYEFSIMNLSDASASGGASAAAGPASGDPDEAVALAPGQATAGGASGFSQGQPWLVEWSVPVFNAKDVSNIKAPEGWAYEVIRPVATSASYNNIKAPFGKTAWSWSATTDPVLKKEKLAYTGNPSVFQKPPLIIHFYSKATKADGKLAPVKPVGPMEMVTGFSFTSPYQAANVPTVSSMFGGKKARPVIVKAVTPNSPSLKKAGGVKISQSK